MPFQQNLCEFKLLHIIGSNCKENDKWVSSTVSKKTIKAGGLSISIIILFDR